uniref:Uncharacterized protein n=1 Tax=Thermodesulfobacterium geofontis TaxID=1295609 RepID=A0A7C4JQD1_9BACT
MRRFKNFNTLLNDLKWFIEKGLYLFLLIEVIRLSLLLFGRKARNRIVKLCKLEESIGIIRYGSFKVILRFMDVGIFKEIFEWNIYRVSNKQKGVIIDVGANIGTFFRSKIL